ncbi:PREDICTED: nucleosome assembly protein 1-like 1-like [Chrysochloris asiatica]|uniref:Nucleosome assembly protein 1-like 1-like n=1 Tax=Chrysochloris asiatica TaxID=185453 RepID=A0A9B0U0D3_CHRAS|nr:PREDICTED: nucleosome assembly protein 1-like 1-like [Chrysochloris asiatica]
MAATAEPDPSLDSQEGAVKGAGSDPDPDMSHTVPAEEEAIIAEVAFPQVSYMADEELWEEQCGQEAAGPEEETQLVQQTEDGKENYKQEYKNEEDDTGDTLQEEVDAQEDADDEDAAEYPLVRFRSLLWGLFRSLLHRLYRNNHIMIRYHTGQGEVRQHRSLESGDPWEEPMHWEGEKLSEEDALQKLQEYLESDDYQNLGQFQEPVAGAEFWEAKEPKPKTKIMEGRVLTKAAISSEMGACASKGAKARKQRQNPLGKGNKSLAQVVKQRVNALKNLQAKYAQIESGFYKDLYNLEMKYAAFFQPLFDKRSDIINAIYEPTEDECQWEVSAQEGVGVGEEMKREPEGKLQISGIPHFWLTALKNVKILRKLIQEKDELILKHLKDIKIKFSEVEEPMTFAIKFFFEPNEYFFNEVLTKTYCIRSDPDDSDPFFTNGPEIIRSSGCEIYWKEGKNVIMKTIKLPKFEGNGSVSTTTCKVPSYSFFTYFYPSDSPEGRLLGVTIDFKLAYIFRELLVPKSVLVFMNGAVKYSSESSDELCQEYGDKEKEEEENKEREGRPKKDMGSAEGNPR